MPTVFEADGWRIKELAADEHEKPRTGRVDRELNEVENPGKPFVAMQPFLMRAYPDSRVANKNPALRKSLSILEENDIIELQRSANQARAVKNQCDVSDGHRATGGCIDSDFVVSNGGVFYKHFARGDIESA
jgi:hypothetical protein